MSDEPPPSRRSLANREMSRRAMSRLRRHERGARRKSWAPPTEKEKRTSRFLAMMGEDILSPTMKETPGGLGQEFRHDEKRLTPKEMLLVATASNWIIGQVNGKTRFINKMTGETRERMPKGAGSFLTRAQERSAERKRKAAAAGSKQARRKSAYSRLRGMLRLRTNSTRDVKQEQAKAGPGSSTESSSNSKSESSSSSSSSSSPPKSKPAKRTSREGRRQTAAKSNSYHIATQLAERHRRALSRQKSWDGYLNTKCLELSKEEKAVMLTRLVANTPSHHSPWDDYGKVRVLYKGPHIDVFLVRSKSNIAEDKNGTTAPAVEEEEDKDGGRKEDEDAEEELRVLKFLHVDEVKKISDLKLRLAMQEMKLLSILRHPYLPRLLDLYEVAPELSTRGAAMVMVLEYFPGGELFGRLEEIDYYTERDIRIVLKKLLQVLRYLHSHHILHNDIKPENVCLASVTDHTDVRLIDFDSAVVMTDGGRVMRFAASPGYCPPEDFLSTKGDIYSLGALAYVALTGYCAPGKEHKYVTKWFGDAYKMCTPACLRIVESMMTKDEGMRPSAAKLLAMDWFTMPAAEVPDVPLTRSQSNLCTLNASMKVLKVKSPTNIKRRFKSAVQAMKFSHHLSKQMKKLEAVGEES